MRTIPSTEPRRHQDRQAAQIVDGELRHVGGHPAGPEQPTREECQLEELAEIHAQDRAEELAAQHYGGEL